jgi:uncharacterized repeat protein (TIGR01451 family)
LIFPTRGAIQPWDGNMDFSQHRSQRSILSRTSKRKSRSAKSGRGLFAIERLERRAMLAAMPVGILLLNHTAADTLLSASLGGVHVTGGGKLVIDSKNALAGVDSGVGKVTATEIDVTGKLKAYGPGQFVGTVLHPAALADPLASLPAPVAAKSVQKLVNVSGNTTKTLSPGTYEGILISGNARVNLLPGLYILKSSGLRVLGNGRLTGTGVTIYNDPKNASGQILVTSGASVSLSAPTSGTYKNVVLFQARSSSVPITLSGGKVNLVGEVYAAKALLNVVGTANLVVGAPPALGITSELIVDSLISTGLGGVNVDATPTSVADVAVAISGPSTVTAGTNATYVITVTNNGPDAALHVQLTDVIPTGTSFVSATQTAGPAFTLSNPAVGGTGTVSGSIATLAAGGSASFQIVVRADSSDANGSTISDTAQVGSSGLDLNGANNSATTSGTVATSADLLVSMSGPATVVPGDSITYEITVTNNGPSDAQGTSVSDTLPAGVSLVSFLQTSGPANLGTLPAGGTQTFELIVTTSDSATVGTVLVNVATESASTTDPDSTNNSATLNTAVVAPQADIATTMTGPTTALAGESNTYHFTFTNNGPNDATVGYSFSGPAGAIIQSITQTSGPAGGHLAPGESISYDAVVSTASNTLDGTVITETVTALSDTADPNSANNSASVSTTINQPEAI